jgi:hypothetical protein
MTVLDQGVVITTGVGEDTLDDGCPRLNGAEDDVFRGMLVHHFVPNIRLLEVKGDR